MVKLGKTRPLPEHSQLGSISTNSTSSWCPSTHQKSNKGGSVPVICSVSSGTPKRDTTNRLTGAGSLLPPVYSEEWAKGNTEVSPGHQSPPLLHTGEVWSKGNAKDPQNTIFLFTGRRTRQTCRWAN
ncbi:hypothetical protein TNCV_1638451 [Trichonephila clavipes]|nr:hypothetical protein TNCV_1638451 [Trichonephila clavipes]